MASVHRIAARVALALLYSGLAVAVVVVGARVVYGVAPANPTTGVALVILAAAGALCVVGIGVIHALLARP